MMARSVRIRLPFVGKIKALTWRKGARNRQSSNPLLGPTGTSGFSG